MKVSNTAERLKEIMNLKHLKQVDVLEASTVYSKETGVKLNRSDLSQYLSGKVEPGQSKLVLLGKTLGVSPVWLMGVDVPMYPTDSPIPFQAVKVETLTVPLLGGAGCGEACYDPAESNENVEVDTEIKADFALRCEGDSMIGARLYDNDLVFFRATPDVDDGDIAAVEVDGEMLIKRVFHLQNGAIMLQSENPRYKPRIVGNDVYSARIVGKAIAFRSVL